MRYAVCIAVVVLFALPGLARAQAWEYRVEEVDLITKVRVFANDLLLSDDDLEDLLEPLGQEGWELIGTISRGDTSLLLVFKRPVHPAVAAAPAPAPVPIQTRPDEPPGPSPDKGGTPVPPAPAPDADRSEDAPAPATAEPETGAAAGQEDPS